MKNLSWRRKTASSAVHARAYAAFSLHSASAFCHFIHLLWQMWQNFIIPVFQSFLYTAVKFDEIIL
jgi:hypothetical protein